MCACIYFRIKEQRNTCFGKNYENIIYTSEFERQIVKLYQNGKRKCDRICEHDIDYSLLDVYGLNKMEISDFV